MYLFFVSMCMNACLLYTSLTPAFQIVPAYHRLRMNADLKYVTDKLVANRIQYSLACGTLLGAIRSNCILLWDDDIDLYVLVSDIPQIRTLFSTMVYETCFGVQIVRTDRIGVDLFELHPERRNNQEILSYRPDSGNADVANWRNTEYLTQIEWESITAETRIGDHLYHAPANSLPYLTRAYTTNFDTNAIIARLHNDNRSYIQHTIQILHRGFTNIVRIICVGCLKVLGLKSVRFDEYWMVPARCVLC
jgi:hypothetical protein